MSVQRRRQPKLTQSQHDDAKMAREADRLIREGRMPPLDKVLAAVEEARLKYQQAILKARKLVR